MLVTLLTAAFLVKAGKVDRRQDSRHDRSTHSVPIAEMGNFHEVLRKREGRIACTCGPLGVAVNTEVSEMYPQLRVLHRCETLSSTTMKSKGEDDTNSEIRSVKEIREDRR